MGTWKLLRYALVGAWCRDARQALARLEKHYGRKTLDSTDQMPTGAYRAFSKGDIWIMAKKPITDLVPAEPPTPSAIDPVEAAKMTEGGSSASEEVHTKVPVEEPVLPPPAPVEAKQSGIFVVKNTNKVSLSWGLQTITLRPGDEVSEDSYGDGAIKKMQDAGVSLVPKK